MELSRHISPESSALQRDGSRCRHGGTIMRISDALILIGVWKAVRLMFYGRCGVDQDGFNAPFQGFDAEPE